MLLGKSKFIASETGLFTPIYCTGLPWEECGRDHRAGGPAPIPRPPGGLGLNRFIYTNILYRITMSGVWWRSPSWGTYPCTPSPTSPTSSNTTILMSLYPTRCINNRKGHPYRVIQSSIDKDIVSVPDPASFWNGWVRIKNLFFNICQWIYILY